MRASGYYVIAALLVLATVPMYRYIFARAREVDRVQRVPAIAPPKVVSRSLSGAYTVRRVGTERPVQLLPGELCYGGAVILVTGSTYTQVVGAGGLPLRCRGRELIRNQ